MDLLLGVFALGLSFELHMLITKAICDKQLDRSDRKMLK